ncbi:MAG: CCA tRNA nucleotidyltransferase [Elusimicrobiaceae bacterium]|nr:CCA tRNA nucleotidyltransferase [Elusimicrobiaceae bacterium]
MENLAKIIQDAAPRAYYVGGALRNSLLKKYSTDIDIALPRQDLPAVAKNLARRLKASAFEMDSEFGVWRVSSKKGLQIDVCAIIGKDIKQDLKRRDFTINAFACPVEKVKNIKVRDKSYLLVLNSKDILDLNKGLKDLKEKVIRANNTLVFKEDPLRLFRAFRTSAQLNFKIAPRTLALIKKYSKLADKPAGERIQEEFKKIFKEKNSAFYLQEMQSSGLFKTLLPEIEKQINCAECYYGKGGVWRHTLLVVERIEFLLDKVSEVFKPYGKQMAAVAQDKALYKMAAFLHDIAKPKTAKMKKGRLRFFYHEEKGAIMAKEFLKQLKYSNDEIKLICKMIEFHLRPSNLASNEIMTDKGIYKFFKELGPAALPMLLLCWADYTSYVSPAQMRALIKKAHAPIMTLEEARKKENIGKTLRHMQMLNFLISKYFTEKQKIVLPPKLLDGKQVMQILNIEPSPLVGSILEKLTLAQVEGKISDGKTAENWLLKYIKPTLKKVKNK